MVLKFFRYFLTVGLILSGPPCLKGMPEHFQDLGRSASDIMIFPNFGYSVEDSNLIDLVFLKALSEIIFLVKNGKHVNGINPSEISPEIRPLFGRGSVSIRPEDYLVRMKRYFGCPSSTCYVLALLYIERIIQKYGAVIFNRISFHRLFLSALTVASKFVEDKFATNVYYSEVGGVSPQELRKLEGCFLCIIEFNIFVSEEEYTSFVSKLKNEEESLKKWFLSSIPDSTK